MTGRRWTFIVLVIALAGALAAITLRKGEARAVQMGWPPDLAHRGSSLTAPENTMEAFRVAKEGGAGGLELDVHMTRDGEVVVIHDDTVDRTTDGSGLVRERSLEELRRLDAGYRFTTDGGKTYPFRGRRLAVPTLEEVYRAFPGMPINVEIKEDQPGVEEEVLRIIREAGAQDHTLVASGKHVVIRRFRAIAGEEIRTAASRREIYAFFVLSRLRLEGLLRPPYEALQVPADHRGITVVTPRFISAAHEQGVRVYVWTINDPREMRRLLDMDVDGVITKHPAALREVLEQRGMA
jgi:glycerophosphoryl diester phosphodiesterase